MIKAFALTGRIAKCYLIPREGTEKVKSTFRLKVNGGEIVVLPFFFCLT